MLLRHQVDADGEPMWVSAETGKPEQRHRDKMARRLAARERELEHNRAEGAPRRKILSVPNAGGAPRTTTRSALKFAGVIDDWTELSDGVADAVAGLRRDIAQIQDRQVALGHAVALLLSEREKV